MFRELCQEINNKLGAGFVLYYNEDVSDPRKINYDKGQTPAVFRVTSGSIQPLKGDAGLQATVNIDFFAKIEDASDVAKIDRAIERLVSERNGELVVQAAYFQEDEELVERELYRYVCNYQVPRTLGNTQIGPDSDRYVLKQLTFSVVLSSTLVFGDSGVCYLSENEITDQNKANALIPGVLRWSLNTQTYASDNAEINKTHVTSIPINAGAKPLVVGLAKQDERFVSIMDNALENPQKLMHFRIEFLGKSYEYRVAVERFLTTGVLSDFVSYELALVPVPDWL